MDMPNPTLPPTKRPYAKTALLIHALAMLAAGCVLSAGVLLDRDIDERYVVYAVGSAAAIVFGIWSVVLAIKSWRNGYFGWAFGVLALLFLTELNLPILYLWTYVFGYFSDERGEVLDWILWLGLPVFIPFLSLTLVAAWLGRLAVERLRKRKPPATPPDPVLSGTQKTFRSRVRWWLATALILVVLVLPWPLFLYCASAPVFFTSRGEADSWGGWLADATPDFVRDTTESMLRLLPFEWSKEADQRILGMGRVSPGRLRQLSRGTADPWVQNAVWGGMRRTNPEAALEFAELIGNGTVPTKELDEMSIGTYLGSKARMKKSV